MRVPSDEALELLDFLVEVGSVGVAGAATSAQLVEALDIRRAEELDILLRELIDGNFVRRKLPATIAGKTTYFVDQSQYDKLLKSLDDDLPAPATTTPTNWEEIRADIRNLSEVVATANLSQEKKAQAGALTESIRILAEAPNPPSKIIRNLLYDLAAMATLFALALQIADKIK